MITKTLKTLVLKTVTVGSVKLPTPADRIGLGLAVVVADYPADVLSRGQFPLPHNPAPDNGSGPRQEPSAPQMHEQMRATATAVPPAGPAGCLRFPGTTAFRRPWSFTVQPVSGWRATAKRAGRTSSHAGAGRLIRLGSDCQSPSRLSDRRPASSRMLFRRSFGVWEMAPVAAAGK
jgi:hypothetical protein